MAKGKYQRWLSDDGLLLLQAWARDGLTDEQIATKMGIATGTLYEYKKKYCEIDEALKKGKEPVDIEVENALLKRALGYQYTEVTSERCMDKETGETFMAITKQIVKEVVPDVGAQAFWLKNRRPDLWRDKRETEFSGGLDVGNNTLDSMIAAAGYKKE